MIHARGLRPRDEVGIDVLEAVLAMAARSSGHDTAAPAGEMSSVETLSPS